MLNAVHSELPICAEPKRDFHRLLLRDEPPHGRGRRLGNVVGTALEDGAPRQDEQDRYDGGLIAPNLCYLAPVLHLLGQDSCALARKAGISLVDARRITGSVIGRARTLRDARNVRREVLDQVEALSLPGEIRRLEAVDARDGFRKYLFTLPDGVWVEAVRIPLYDTHHVVCLLSQAGCAMACAFCATGELGLTRSLKSWEMVAQLLHVRADSQRPVTGVVFMGQGEPFLNYDEVLQAAYALCDPAGGRIDARRSPSRPPASSP